MLFPQHVFASVVERDAEMVRETNHSVVCWRKSWLVVFLTPAYDAHSSTLKSEVAFVGTCFDDTFFCMYSLDVHPIVCCFCPLASFSSTNDRTLVATKLFACIAQNKCKHIHTYTDTLRDTLECLIIPPLRTAQTTLVPVPASRNQTRARTTFLCRLVLPRTQLVRCLKYLQRRR